MLSQCQDGIENVISYASLRLDPAQHCCCMTQHELFAVVCFPQHFWYYLLARQFAIPTDHGSLAWLFQFKAPDEQLTRWLEELS